jgi:ComF family protein
VRLSSLLGLLYPTSCLGCGRARTALCAACAPPPGAVRAFALDGFEVRALGRYGGVLRRAILRSKRGRRDVGAALATAFAERMSAALPARTVLVPIPTAGSRRRERGFDQSVGLARALGARAGRPVLLALRLTARDAQRGRSRRERLAARGRFRCDAPDLVDGIEVVLVDDVVTTGATLRDCAATLAGCGARVRGALVLAYA